MKKLLKPSLSFLLLFNLNLIGCAGDDGEAIRNAAIDDQIAHARDGYSRYRDMAEPALAVEISTTVVGTRSADGRRLAQIMRDLVPSDHLVPYTVAVRQGAPDQPIHTGLRPRFELWGTNGYPARRDYDPQDVRDPDALPGATAGVVTPTPAPTATPAPSPTTAPTPWPTIAPTPWPTIVPTPWPTATPWPSPSPTVCENCTFLGSPTEEDGQPIAEPTAIGDQVALADSPSALFLNHTLPNGPAIAVTELAVRVTIGGQARDHMALVVHYPQGPLVLDEVLLGVNNFVRHSILGDDRTAPVFAPTERWTRNGDGCQSYRAYEYKKLVWGVYNCFGLNHLFDVWVSAELSATLTCSPYTKEGGAKGCKLVSFAGSASGDGQGGSWCFSNFYVTKDSVAAKDYIEDESGIRIGVDYSLGAAADLVNTTTAKVDAKLEGTATHKKIGGTGSVHVEIDHPGGSYGGAEVKLDGEVICPDYVAP